jgi:hypothetical protein
VSDQIGRWLIGLGALLALVGVVVLALGRFVKLGALPGDIRVDRPNVSVRFPLVTSILLSLVLTLLLNIALRIWRR